MLTTIDYKSKTDAGAKMFISPEHLLQLSAYWGATHYRENGVESSWGVVGKDQRAKQAAIIKLSPKFVGVGEGSREVVDPETGKKSWEPFPAVFTEAELRTGFEQFRNCLDIFFWLVKRGGVKAEGRNVYQYQDLKLVSVTFVIQHVIAKPGLLNWYAKMAREGKSPEEERDKRAKEGTVWHKNALFYSRGDKVDLTDAPESLSAVITNLAQWQQKVKFKALLLETAVAHPELGYAGTMDGLVDINLEGN